MLEPNEANNGEGRCQRYVEATIAVQEQRICLAFLQILDVVCLQKTNVNKKM